MERVNALINKLQEQSMQHATAADLLNTVQLLQAELVRHITAPATAPARTAGTAKVAVMMPNGNANYGNANYANGTNYANGANGANGYQNGSSQQYSSYQPVPAPVEKRPPLEVPAQWEQKAQKEEEQRPAQMPAQPVQAQPIQAQPIQAQPIQAQPIQKEIPQQKSMAAAWPLDPLREVPTLSHQEQARELNDIIGPQHTSFNDRLKPLQTELGDVLTEVPVRDLKKAIGINDRYVFVNELFRGDEAMYERSLKTINAFRILPEAEYWMERELKVKLGWDDGKTTTQHFYQLVRRRFS